MHEIKSPEPVWSTYGFPGFFDLERCELKMNMLDRSTTEVTLEWSTSDCRQRLILACTDVHKFNFKGSADHLCRLTIYSIENWQWEGIKYWASASDDTSIRMTFYLREFTYEVVDSMDGM